jgi:hypothetical protein
MWLKQSTAVTVKMGPFVDDTDGKTAETGLTISQADIRLTKNGANIAQSNNAAGATHDELGYYGVPLDTTDTNTLGTLRVAISESGALPVWQDFMVVPANVWDSLFGADKLQVDAREMAASLITSSQFAAGAIDAAAIAANALGASELATDAVNEIRDAVTDDVVEAEASITLQQALSVILAAVAGVTASSGAVFKTPDGAATRITATVNASKERTGMVLAPSA